MFFFLFTGQTTEEHNQLLKPCCACTWGIKWSRTRQKTSTALINKT